MQRLRIYTTALLIFGVILVFGFPVVLLRKPGTQAPVREREIFALTITGYFLLMIIVLCLIMWLSWKLWRRQTEELADKQMENLKELVEGTLNDHSEKKHEDA